MSNDFTKTDYLKSHVKADKRFSILPSVITFCGDIKNKTVLDLGCGDGFFTEELAKKCGSAIGVDNNKEQIARAKKHKSKNTKYIELDIFKEKLPPADVVTGPFVLNYAKNVGELKKLFISVFESLNAKGRFVGVIDLPEKGGDLKKFGTVKKVEGTIRDEATIKIELYNEGMLAIILRSQYYSQQTVKKLLEEAGFNKIVWKMPLVSPEGIKYYGSSFWNEYVENSGLGYFTAQKE